MTESKKDTTAGQTTSRSISPLADYFAKSFNAALDDKNIPVLHYGRQKWVADRFGVSKSAARKWVTGDGLPDLEKIVMIADDLGQSIDAMLGRIPSATAKRPTVAIPIQTESNDLQVADQIFGGIVFDEGVLETTMRMRKNGVEMHVISTDSMSPSLNIGDIALIDTEARKLTDNRLYMFSTKDRILIRRVMWNLDDTVKLMCSNPNYPEITLNLSDIDTGDGVNENHVLKMMGEIAWVIKKMNSSGYGSPTPTR
jgi:transcriptional regulator with XRE-family HTH domain